MVSRSKKNKRASNGANSLKPTKSGIAKGVAQKISKKEDNSHSIQSLNLDAFLSMENDHEASESDGNQSISPAEDDSEDSAKDNRPENDFTLSSDEEPEIVTRNIPDEFNEAMDEDASDDEILEHQKELAKLKDKQPEFYHYLMENDQDLLEFGSSEDEGEEEENQETNLNQSSKTKGLPSVTTEMIKQWEAQLKNPDSVVAAIKNITYAFRSAVMTEFDEVQTTGYLIDRASLQKQIFVLALSEIPKALTKLFGKEKMHVSLSCLPFSCFCF
jgi:nucleolar complex protein 2